MNATGVKMSRGSMHIRDDDDDDDDDLVELNSAYVCGCVSDIE